ncbi:hypothetical protein HYT00_02875 [Candidatus Giovannonibacteria bacterium]|nr:hypothetical protein [Candidatus Giovannonibacteria bacterium]
MAELLSQLGINFKLLLSQGVNFLAVLAVLTFFIYRPLLKILNERRQKIEFGLKGAKEAEKKLAEIEAIKLQKLRESEEKAFSLIKDAEEKAGKREGEIISEANKKADELLEKAAEVEEHRKVEALSKLSQEAKTLIRAALGKMVLLKPEQIDESLLEEAVREIKKQKI